MNSVSIEPFHVIGITVRTSNNNNEGLKDIGALWQRWRSENLTAFIPHKVSNKVYSIYSEYAGDYTEPYTVLLGCAVKNLDFIPEGMIGMSFQGGTYEKFTAKGNLMEGVVAQAWEKIWASDLPRAYTADFEIYDERSHNLENAEVDIFIAIK